MLRLFIGLFFLSSCSLGVTKNGGERTYVYDVSNQYSVPELRGLSSQVVTTMARDPKKGKLVDLFSKKQAPIKRVGILVFESELQPTRSGLSNADKIFLNEQGKQLLTEKLLSVWEESFPILGKGVEYVNVSKIKHTQTFKTDGFAVEDYIKSKREALAPDDVFYLPVGKKTATRTILNPRGMRDLSLALVPASDLMSGPKFSEHAKHTLNEVAKELNLDAMFIVMNRIHWTASHIDKKSGEFLPEELVIKLEASTLVPLSKYRDRMSAIGETRDVPSTTIAYRSYETTLKIPVLISVPEDQQNFDTIEKELLTPVFKTYKDLAHMLQIRIVEDIKKTNE